MTWTACFTLPWALLRSRQDPPAPEPNDDGEFRDGESEETPRRNRGLPLLLLAALGVVLLFYLGREGAGEGERKQIGEIVNRLKNRPDTIVSMKLVGSERVEGEYKDDSGRRVKFYANVTPAWVESGELTTLMSEQLADGNWEIEESDTVWRSLIVSLLPWVLIMLFLWFVFFRQMRAMGPGSGVFSFGKSRAKLYQEDDQRKSFEDVAGIDEAVEEVRELVDYLKNPKKYEKIGARIPRGILLVGPPGTGKTLLAKAIAGEAGVPFFSISGSDFVEMFVGVGASRVRDLFRTARAKSPCIIFLDEIDAVGRRRGTGLGGGHDEREQTLNSILVEMDGFESDEHVIIMAATNRPDVLDPALLRPGRFDRTVDVPTPDIQGREAILRVHIRKVKAVEDIDLERVARGTPGFAGAELEAVINEAALAAVHRGKHEVELSDLEAARDKIMWGKERRSLKQSKEDLATTAWHEAGHALLQITLEHADPLHKVTIVPRGRALGATMPLPKKDVFNLTREQMLDRVRILYGGRIAEQIGVGTISTGAANDIREATRLAKQMVTEFGMDEALGPIRYTQNEEHVFLGYEVSREKDHSEATSEAIDGAIKALITTCYQDAERVIESHKTQLERLATALLEFESLDAAEVDIVIQGGDLAEHRAKAAAAPKKSASTKRMKSLDQIDVEGDAGPLIEGGQNPSPATS